MSNCPKCGGEIANAAYCGCGWKRGKSPALDAPKLLTECAHMSCQTRAIMKIRTPTGWANFCEHHAARYSRDKAEKTCRDLGLDTTEKKREYVRAGLKKLARKWAPAYDEAA